MDRRVLKTKNAIVTAFLELIEEKSFEKITINEIATRADVNRGTVYLHFVDKYDLLNKCIETYILELLHHCRSDVGLNDGQSTIYKTFDYLEKNYKSYQALLTNEGIHIFRERLYEVIFQIVQEVPALESDNTQNAKLISEHFLTSAIVGVLEWWLVHSLPCSAEDISNKLEDLVSVHLV